MTKTEQERLAVLETKVETLTSIVEEQSRLIRELRDALMQAKGARWFIAGLIATASTMTGIAGYFWPR